jgi:hypothetical protein
VVAEDGLNVVSEDELNVVTEDELNVVTEDELNVDSVVDQRSKRRGEKKTNVLSPVVTSSRAQD